MNRSSPMNVMPFAACLQSPTSSSFTTGPSAATWTTRSRESYQAANKSCGARGYAPLPIGTEGSEASDPSDPSAPVLAVGAHMKNTVAIAMGSNVFLSQHIGDLQTNEAFGAFRRAIDDLESLYETPPRCIVGDMHPDYGSTRYGQELAESRGIPFVPVQHHWAHVLSCMSENDVQPPALGVAWDGTGYGLDGTIWGGEFLLARRGGGFDRVAHFRCFPLPGGDASARRPEYAAAGILYEIFGAAGLPSKTPPLLQQMLEKG